MASTSFELVSETQEALMQFWGETLRIEPDGTGAVIIALPLMFPDGLQVTVHIQALTSRSLLISDLGETLGNLVASGLSIEGQAISDLLGERLQVFELERVGLELRKTIRIPIEGVEVQLFAEALVSIAHLFYRLDPESTVENVADRAVQRIFQDRSLQPKRNAFLEGRLEKRIKVDYFLTGKRPLALQVVNRRKDLLPYMEQWGWRWSDLRGRNLSLLPAMVYDPDNQSWDETSLTIGRTVCEIFCPYFDRNTIELGLKEVMG